MKSAVPSIALLLATCSQLSYGHDHGHLNARDGDEPCTRRADMKLCSGGNGTGDCYPNTFAFQKCYDLAGSWTQARTLTPHQTWYDCYAYTTPCPSITPAAEVDCKPAMDCDLKINNAENAKALFFPGTDYRSWDLQLYHLQGMIKSFACFSRLPSGESSIVE
ncbi:hypothetical protein PG997_014831 [Apiospora hydei]|uniref:Uncharacterized protein n=1 Tax=Apiospora hydei TaxID=1337664 RepID=A0ABR1UY49_9PEZI